MNCRSEVLEVSVEGRQVEEAMLAVLHTILLHRSTGKFHYKKEGTYSIGTVGIQDVDCDFIDFTYVRISSEELDRALRKVVGEFKIVESFFGGSLGLSHLARRKDKNSQCWWQHEQLTAAVVGGASDAIPLGIDSICVPILPLPMLGVARLGPAKVKVELCTGFFSSNPFTDELGSSGSFEKWPCQMETEMGGGVFEMGGGPFDPSIQDEGPMMPGLR
ncbi:autophagy-related protein 101, partial [Sigmodon hispidus]